MTAGPDEEIADPQERLLGGLSHALSESPELCRRSVSSFPPGSDLCLVGAACHLEA